jgi:hypothetical protein
MKYSHLYGFIEYAVVPFGEVVFGPIWGLHDLAAWVVDRVGFVGCRPWR